MASLHARIDKSRKALTREREATERVRAKNLEQQERMATPTSMRVPPVLTPTSPPPGIPSYGEQHNTRRFKPRWFVHDALNVIAHVHPRKICCDLLCTGPRHTIVRRSQDLVFVLAVQSTRSCAGARKADCTNGLLRKQCKQICDAEMQLGTTKLNRFPQRPFGVLY